MLHIVFPALKIYEDGTSRILTNAASVPTDIEEVQCGSMEGDRIVDSAKQVFSTAIQDEVDLNAANLKGRAPPVLLSEMQAKEERKRLLDKAYSLAEKDVKAQIDTWRLQGF